MPHLWAGCRINTMVFPACEDILSRLGEGRARRRLGSVNWLRTVSPSLVWFERVAPGFAFQHGVAVLPLHRHGELGDGLGVVHLQHLGLGGNGVADTDRGGDRREGILRLSLPVAGRRRTSKTLPYLSCGGRSNEQVARGFMPGEKAAPKVPPYLG
jgi:hypothetical protein